MLLRIIGWLFEALERWHARRVYRRIYGDEPSPPRSRRRIGRYW